jgi:serine phosphatase RsbU (regulator of sigma subunit)
VGQFGRFAGAFGDSTWSAVDVEVRPGDQLVLYTDGVIDTVGESERFGEERLAAALAAASSPADVVARVDAALTEFARGPQADDTALLAVQRLRDRA